MDDREFMQNIQDRLVSLMRVDILKERWGSGNFDRYGIDINSLRTASGWPMLITEDGDPSYDANSGTPAFILGVMHKHCLSRILRWCMKKGYTIFSDYNEHEANSIREYKENRYTKNALVFYSGSPYDTVSIQNWIGFVGRDGSVHEPNMLAGESNLKLTKEEATRLKTIVEERYVYVTIEGGKVTDFWKEVYGIFSRECE